MYTTELMAILSALFWIEENNVKKAVICSDSLSALISIKSRKSESRQDILLEILCKLYILTENGVEVSFLWVPAHCGVEGNEKVDIIAKQSLKSL